MTTMTQERGPSVRRIAQNGRWQRTATWAGPSLALLAFVAYFSATTPAFATTENFTAILEQAAIPTIAAMGGTLVILIGSVDLSVEGVMAASGITFVLLAANNVNGNDLGMIALVIAVAVGGLFGLLSGVIHTVLRVPSFMTTLGIWFVGLGVATVLFGASTPQLEDSTLRGWAGGRWFGIPVVVVFAIVVVVLFTIIARSTSLGRHAYAIGGDEAVARVAGIRVNRVKLVIFTLAGLAAALAGVLATVRLGVGTVNVGQGQLFLTLAAIVLGGTLLSGGRGGPLHTVVGVLLLVVISNGLLLSGANPYVQQAAQGLIIIVAVIASGWGGRGRLRVVK